MNGPEEDLGIRGVRRLAEILSIDSQWSTPIPRGIAWWAHDFRQRIWAEERVQDRGFSLWRIHVATDFLEAFDVTRPETRGWLGALLPFSTQYAWVHDPASGHLRLWSSSWVHEETFERRLRDLSVAAVLQLSDAQSRAPALAERFSEEIDTSSHPASGRRGEPDEILGVVTQLFIPQGNAGSAWDTPAEFEETVELFNENQSGFGSSGGHGLTLEFAFGDQTSMLRFQTDTPNPGLGNGLLQLLHLPLSLSEDECTDLALRLNREETSEPTWSQLLGSWCGTDSIGSGWTPVFVSFLPNAMRKMGDVPSLAMNQASRARWASAKLARCPDRPVVETVSERYRDLSDDN